MSDSFQERMTAYMRELSHKNNAKIDQSVAKNNYRDTVITVDGKRFRVLLGNATTTFDGNQLNVLSTSLNEVVQRGAFLECALASYHLILNPKIQERYLLSNDGWERAAATRFEGLGNHTVAALRLHANWIAIDPTTSEYIDPMRERMDFLVLASGAQKQEDLIAMLEQVYGSKWQKETEKGLASIEHVYKQRWVPK